MVAVKPSVVALHLHVVIGPDAGRTFRFLRATSFEVRARSDADDDGLALRTDAADGTAIRFSRVGRRWNVERLAGPELFVNDVATRATALDGGMVLRVGGTTLDVALTRETAPAPVEPDREAMPAVTGFELLAPVAFGAAAQTWLARRLLDGVLVALKVARPGATDAIRRDFRREAEIAEALAGVPHTAELVGSGSQGAQPWLAFRWIDGETLEERVARDGVLELSTACLVAGQVLDVLRAAHARQFVHRDVNPANVMLGRVADRAPLSAYLIDFGLGKAVRVASDPADATVNPTRTGESMGRPRFLAPEQAADGKRAGPASDLYGLAATLYWALTRASHIREDPSESPLASLAKGHLIPIRRRRRDVPEALAIALDQALSRDLERRWEAFDPLRRELELVSAPRTGI